MQTLKFNLEQTKRIIEEYYKKYEDFDGKVTISSTIGSVGYGPAEHNGLIKSIKIEGNLDILGEKVPMNRNISDEEVQTIFKTVLEEEGYTVSDVKIDCGVKNTTEGYGMTEHTVSKPYFRGVNVTLNNKKLVK